MSKKLVPKLRFSGFDDEWKNIQLGDLFEFSVAGDLKNESFNEEQNKVFKYPLYANSVENDGLLGYYDNYKYEENSLTITARGVNIGHAVTRKEKFNAVGRLLILNSKKDVNLDFFSEYINSKLKIYIESTGVPQLTAPSIKINKVNCPKLEEQDKIANFLNIINNKIELLENKHESYLKFKKYLMQQIFTQKLRFNEFDDEWKTVKLSNVAEIVGGGTPNTEVEEYWNGGIKWFTPSEIGKTKYISESDRHISEEGLKNSSAKLLPKNTILLSSRATVGEISIALTECSTNQGFQSLITKNTVDNEFIYYLISMMKNEFLRRSSGSTFLEISKNEIKKIKINIPSLSEQKMISSIFSSIDKKIDLLKIEHEKCSCFKKALLQQMFV